MIAGFTLVIAAVVLQGVFLLPMSRSRQWGWEHKWLAFSLTGMIACNWILAFVLLPAPWSIYIGAPLREIIVLASCGVAWGVGAVLFGLGIAACLAKEGAFVVVNDIRQRLAEESQRILVAEGHHTKV